MAQVVVDSRVMRDKARTIENAAVTIQTLYAEMLQEVTATTNRMKGEAIETAKERFASMQNRARFSNRFSSLIIGSPRRNSELFLRGESTGRIFTYAKDLCEFSGIGANRNRVRNGCL